jgi:sensor histidine kinase YesM
MAMRHLLRIWYYTERREIRMKRKTINIVLRVLQHLAFWGVAFIALLNIFTIGFDIKKIDYIYTTLFIGTIVWGIYINLFILIPKLLRGWLILLYIVLISGTVALTAYANEMFFMHLSDYLLPGYYFISYYEFSSIVLFSASLFAITTLLKLSKSWFATLERDKQIAQINAEKRAVELSSLKEQIHPHFLFNTLNGIYSQALDNSKETPNSVLLLSEMLRYMIYEANEDFITLKKEIDYVQRFVSLLKQKTDYPERVTINVDGYSDDIKIAPLLFSPLIDNAYKHGLMRDIRHSYVNIDILIADNGVVTFTIKNNLSNNTDKKQNSFGGIGLNNLTQRLKLIYPNRHTFNIDSSNNSFKVEMTINTNAD